MKVQVELYGRLRESGAHLVELEVKEGATAAEVLEKLKTSLGPKAALLKGCVLATDGAVLAPGEKATFQKRLAALPPVCGG